MITQLIAPLTSTQKMQITELIKAVGWTDDQINGQIDMLNQCINEKNSVVYVSLEKEVIVGFISAQFYAWNRLAQIHGLVVHPSYRNAGRGSVLVEHVEDFMKQHNARGIYVDTPVNNEIGKKFYIQQKYCQDYIMTDYYDTGVNGVTFLKLFSVDNEKK